MKFGAHVSIAGGIANAPLNASKIGCETFQMFSRSPRGGKPSDLTKEVVKEFKNNCQDNNYDSYYLHTPYYINFLSTNNQILKGSIEVVRQELERGDKLGVRATMTHLGSAKDIDSRDIVNKTAEALIATLKGYRGQNKFLIEIAAGAGQIVGDNFEQIAAIIKIVEDRDKSRLVRTNTKIGVCFDTCHAFASGYDLRNKQQVAKTFKLFDQTIGLDRLEVIHMNDSLTEFDSHKDRHANLGKGMIGIDGIKAILAYPKFKNMDFILETPWVDGEKSIKKDINILKKLRKMNL